MTKWEYCTVHQVDARAGTAETRAGEAVLVTVTFHERGQAQSASLGATFEGLGQDGWELVAVRTAPAPRDLPERLASVIYYFKRPVEANQHYHQNSNQ